ncbi:D-aspartate ligase [Enterococcus saigonensis]|uniref:D-aspartate ligase n=2 Tax=Enterococcus saigonensis TaxID=1805431 RepID=A0A679I8C4_9ENTE|nr:D-aspartate ligase [Enterococcus saigonensis]
MEQQPFVPILLGSDMNVYGMARAFYEEYGMKSTAYASFQLAPTKYSKIVDVHVIAGFDQDPVFSEKLLELAKSKYNDPSIKYLLVACGDGYAELLSQHKEDLKDYYVFAANDYSLFEKLINKVSFYDICEKYQLPYPKTLIITKDMVVEGKLNQDLPFDFPVALKPANSVEWLSVDFEGRKKAFIIDNLTEFNTILDRLYKAGYKSEMIAQDFIPGDDSNMRVLNAYVDQKGNTRFMFLGHPLLEDPAPAAVGNYVVIVPDENDEIYQTIKNFLEKIDYVGFANFDMKYDRRDGQYKLFEINLRQGRSSFFVTLSGFNLAKYVTEDLVFNSVFRETEYGRKENPNAKVWLGVPKKVFRKYAKDNADKQYAEKLIKEGRYGTTLFYEKDSSIRRYVLMKYAFHNYVTGFKKYFSEKEG